MTIPPITSGTWTKDNTNGLYLRINLGSPSGRTDTSGAWSSGNFDGADGSTGAVTWATTSGATFYMTGCQIELGTEATPFDHRSFGDELLRCQRYCIDLTPTSGTSPYIGASAAAGNTTVAVAHIALPVQMRATPSATLSGTAGNYTVFNGADRTCTSYAINGMSPLGGGINFTCSGGGLTANDACGIYVANTNVRSIIEAEL
jgi:hypothetical protein